LVAFANSEQGGTIVLGLEEIEGDELVIVGCPGGVRAKRAILRIAEHCVPPIAIAVADHVYSRKRVFRVDIAASPQRPHCTDRGVYTIREDGQNALLTPDKLRALLTGDAAEPEASSGDGDSLSQEAADLRRQVHRSLQNAEDAIGELGTRIESKLARVATLVEASEEDDFLHIGLSTIKQAQKIGFDSLAKRLDDTSQLLHSLLQRSRIPRPNPTVRGSGSSLPPLVLVQLKRDSKGFTGDGEAGDLDADDIDDSEEARDADYDEPDDEYDEPDDDSEFDEPDDDDYDDVD
jgi:hypothetical protein